MKTLDPLGAFWIDDNGDAHVNTGILAEAFDLPEGQVIVWARQWLRDQGLEPRNIIFVDHREKGQ